MVTVFLIIQIILAVVMVAIILLQNTNVDGLSGMGGGGGGGNNLISGRASANLLTRSTAILATLFMLNSLAMATYVSRSHRSNSIIDQLVPTKTAPIAPEGNTPKPENTSPAVPIAE